jgi:hypothetical protein
MNLSGSKRLLEKSIDSRKKFSVAEENSSSALPFVPPSVALSKLDKAKQLGLSGDQLTCYGAEV